MISLPSMPFLIELPNNFVLKNPVIKDSFLYNNGKKYRINKIRNFYSYIAVGGERKIVLKECAVLDEVPIRQK